MKNDGGPAFPSTEMGNQGIIYFPGMTLRDYFVGQALAGLCANKDYESWSDEYIAGGYKFRDQVCYGVTEENARRILLCVNYCSGFTNEFLEKISSEKINAQKHEFMEELCREQFEEWADSKGFVLDSIWSQDGMPYENEDTALAYEIWKQSRLCLYCKQE